MRRTIATVSAASVAMLVIAAFLTGGARAATPNAPAATAALRYLYGGQKADGSVDGSAGETEDSIIGAADNGYDPATLKTSGGVTAYSYLESLITGAKVTTAGGAAKLILAWVAAGKPAALDGAALVTKLNTAASGGFLQPNGSWLTRKTFGNGFTQALGILADVAAGAALPPHATGWLLCAQQADGGFIDQIDPSGSAPPASGTCGTQSSDTNDTGIALQALHAAGLSSFASALSYLQTAQQADGGFGYDVSSPSDPDSDAVVIEGLVAAGQDPAGSSWTKSGKNPLTNLATFETPAGSGKYAFSAGFTPDTFTTSATPAALALDPYGAKVAFTAGLSPFAAPATPTPSATATATAPATSTPGGGASGAISAPKTGGGAFEPGDAGIAIAVVSAGTLAIGASAAWRRCRGRRR